MSIKLRQLHHLLALDEHGSFIHAAASLHLSQPALSRSIQALEAQTGAPLFLREGHGVVPTDLGRVLIEHARQITRMTDILQNEVVGKRAVACEELVLGTGPFPVEMIFSRAVTRFIDDHPHLKLRVEVRSWDELLLRLRNHELHLFIAETSTLEKEPDLEVEPLPSHPMYFVSRAQHPLAAQRPHGLDRVLPYPIAALARIPPRVLEPVLATLPKTSGAHAALRAFPALLCTDLSMIKRVVADSDAIMVTSLSCVAGELARNEFVVLGTEPWLQLRYGLVKLKAGGAADALALKFREYVMEAERVLGREEQSLIARWITEVMDVPVLRAFNADA